MRAENAAAASATSRTACGITFFPPVSMGYEIKKTVRGFPSPLQQPYTPQFLLSN